MIIKLKGAFIALSIFMTVGAVFIGSALADSVCETLEECQTLKAHLEDQLVQVNARIEELLGGEEKRTTTTGAVFTRDRSNPALGEAWRDPDGLIWGDIVKKTDGISTMNYFYATDYCASIGARLPSKEEFTRLREYMGARSVTHEYSAQILPSLSGYWFWSSSVYPYDTDLVYFFNGSDGYFDFGLRNYYGAVRCVVGR